MAQEATGRVRSRSRAPRPRTSPPPPRRTRAWASTAAPHAPRPHPFPQPRRPALPETRAPLLRERAAKPGTSPRSCGRPRTSCRSYRRAGRTRSSFRLSPVVLLAEHASQRRLAAFVVDPRGAHGDPLDLRGLLHRHLLVEDEVQDFALAG